jgi:hypothetical protein
VAQDNVLKLSGNIFLSGKGIGCMQCGGDNDKLAEIHLGVIVTMMKDRRQYLC